MALASVLNMHTVNWQSPFKWVSLSNYSGLIGLILVAFLPILVLVPFYCLRRAHWSTVEFQSTYGSLLEGTRLKLREGEIKSDWVAILVPIFYFYRRFVFILSVILLRNNILVLILIQVGLI